jgi:hypothetical protein
MLTIVGVKKSLLGSIMEGVVVCELGKCQIRCPIILLVVNGAPKILLQHLIDSLRLTIGLRMECIRKLNIHF